MELKGKFSCMKKKRRLKRWVRVTLYIILAILIFVLGFNIGKKFGMKLVEEEMLLEETTENEIPVLEEENEVLEEEEEQPYVFNPLILVNKKHKLPEEYEVELLTMYDKVNRAAKEAYQPLNDMLAAGRKEGLAFEICSSYRDVKRQEFLFQEDVDALMQRGYTYEEAYAETARETMPPGHSEHSTGLAFDIVSLNYQLLDAKQAATPETLWLHEHCAEYGFILRYPKGKEDITEIDYESWHYRYVGVEAASYIMEYGITLEEYLELNL